MPLLLCAWGPTPTRFSLGGPASTGFPPAFALDVGRRLPAGALAKVGLLAGGASAGKPAPRSSQPPLLRGEEALARVYDFILEARFDQVEAELRRACGPAPAEACDVLGATALWWRILLDPESRALDDEFSASVERAIRTTEAWVERAPQDPEAWFYLGGAYAARVQWRVLREERLAAARDGKRIKEALEQAIELEPRLDDAYFGIGLYKYYADVAPAAARFLRFLLLLPGGDRDEGLEQMLRARERGRLLQGEADYQLHLIYLWYEEDIDRALELLRGLQRQYPANPLFLIQIADIQESYQHDITASLATWRTLLAMAREQRVNAAVIAETRAHLGVARQLEALHQTDRAIEQLQDLIAEKPSAPYSALASGYLRLGDAHDRMGERAQALQAYRAAVAAAPADDIHEIRDKARKRIRETPNKIRIEAYRLSLQGWRRLERKDLAGANDALERSLVLDDRSPVTRYRYGRVLQARREDAAALSQFELVIKDAKLCPAPILGDAYLEAARLHERAGNRDQALSWYRVAAALFGAAEETRAAATRAITRLEKQ
jgi:tetratricopeptide (TPR) repeat protein